MAQFKITKEGLAKLKVKLEYLIHEEKINIAKAIAEARGFGDLSENAEYHAAKENQRMNDAAITNLQSIIMQAEPIDLALCGGDEVNFGCIVTVIDDDTEKKFIYKLVSEYEADLEKNEISIESPVGKALLGKKIGDTVEIKIPAGIKTYEIINLEWK